MAIASYCTSVRIALHVYNYKSVQRCRSLDRKKSFHIASKLECFTKDNIFHVNKTLLRTFLRLKCIESSFLNNTKDRPSLPKSFSSYIPTYLDVHTPNFPYCNTSHTPNVSPKVQWPEQFDNVLTSIAFNDFKECLDTVFNHPCLIVT